MSIMLAGLFLLVFALIMAIAVFGFLYRQQHRQKVVKDMLQTVAGNRPVPVTKLLKDIKPEVAGFARMLKSLNVADHLQSSIKQAGLTWTPSTLFMATVGAAVPGFLIGLRFPFIINEVLSCFSLAAATASLPYMYMRKKRAKRLGKLEEQFPEALDFMSRSVRAGHAFLISLSMVALAGTAFDGTEHAFQRNQPWRAAGDGDGKPHLARTAARFSILYLDNHAAAPDRGQPK
jgi:tight adherence protein B